MKVLDIADWFIVKASEEEYSTDLTVKKLNALCYFAFCLYYRETKKYLFKEKIKTERNENNTLKRYIPKIFERFSCCSFRHEIDLSYMEPASLEKYKKEALKIPKEKEKILQKIYDNFMPFTTIWLEKLLYPDFTPADFALSETFDSYFE